jgi:phosphohistidine swiveling domain-containing protein
MAKLTVYFKNNVVHSYPFEAEKVVHIGRDETNDLVIDSNAFAPAHAAVVIRGDTCVIKQLNDDFPLIINGKQTKMATLHQGDTITVGQHDIVYSTNKINSTDTGQATSRKIIRNSYIPHVANYQVISGANIGKIFHLKNPMMMLGDPGRGIVVITKRKDGYFVSVLEKTGNITINKEPLGDKTVMLNHNDVLAIGNSMTVQFYLQ